MCTMYKFSRYIHFSMHLCRFNHQSDFHYVATVCYNGVPRLVPVVRGPRSVKIGVMTVVEPPSPTVLSGTVTTVPVIISVQGTEWHTIQLWVCVASVDHAVTWNGKHSFKYGYGFFFFCVWIVEGSLNATTPWMRLHIWYIWMKTVPNNSL